MLRPLAGCLQALAAACKCAGVMWRHADSCGLTNHTASLLHACAAWLSAQLFMMFGVHFVLLHVTDVSSRVTERQASSPDEEALVEAAADLGYALVSRTTDRAELRYKDKACPCPCGSLCFGGWLVQTCPDLLLV